MKWHNVEQNTEIWDQLRLGRITCSRFATLFMKETSEGFNDYISEIAYENLTDQPLPEKWDGNDDTEAGHDWEQRAKEMYEHDTFQKIHPGGFWEYDDMVGGSPDGHIGGDGLVEVKSHKTSIWLRRNKQYNKDGEVKFIRGEYKQIQGQLLVSGKQWLDFIIVARDENISQPLVQRVYRDEGTIKEIKEKLERAKMLVNEEMETLKAYLR